MTLAARAVRIHPADDVAVAVQALAAGEDLVVEGERGEPKIHAHVVLGKADGVALGGHLLEAQVRPTLEVMLVESPKHLQRQHDQESGLALIRL